MGLQFSVDQLAEYVTAGIRARAVANRTAHNQERFTGQSVKEMLAESLLSYDNDRELRSTSKPPLPMGLATLLTPQQLSAYLDTPLNTLAQWRSRGLGPRYIKWGHKIRYDQADVVAWLEEQKKCGEERIGTKRREGPFVLPVRYRRPKVQRTHRLGGYAKKSFQSPGDGGLGEGQNQKRRGAREEGLDTPVC